MPPPNVTVGKLLSWRRVAVVLLLGDLVAVASGLRVAYEFRFNTTFGILEPRSPTLPMSLLLAFAGLWLAGLWANGLYRRPNLVSGIGEYRRILTAGMVTTLAIIAVDYLTAVIPLSRGFLMSAALINVFLIGLWRFSLRRVIYQAARGGRHLDTALIVGSNRQAAAVAEELLTSPPASCDVVGFLSDYLPRGSEVIPGLHVLGEPLELQAVATSTGATRALVIESGLSWESLHGLVRQMHGRGRLVVSLVPGIFDLHSTALEAHQLGSVLTLDAQPSRIVGVDAALKRGLDIALSLLALFVSLPIMATLTVARLLRGESLELEKEEVLGAYGPFVLSSFVRPTWAAPAHLARLPNLWLVLAGRMSFVGPRPMPVTQAHGHEDLISVLEGVKPGFIGPWWLVGRGRPLDLEQELAFDLHYLRHYSIWLDVHVLLQVARHFVGLAVRPGPLLNRRRHVGLHGSDLGELMVRDDRAVKERP
jgi:lipopolysaccharide/colanic/teichoic acid biosynthesis glycosyltransferase